VGVIASLATWFAVPVLWHQGGFAWAAAAIVVVALVCLLRWRWSVLQVIGAAALAGVARLLLVQG